MRWSSPTRGCAAGWSSTSTAPTAASPPWRRPASYDVPDGAEVVAADGGLVTEPFVDAHLHLDKVHTLPLIGDAALQAYTGAGMTDSGPGHRPGAGGQGALPPRHTAPGNPLGPLRRGSATGC